MNSIKDRLPATLTTDRLVLTTPTLEHVPDIARLANNFAIYEMMARLPFPYSEDDARFFVEQIAPTDAEHCYAVLLGGTSFMGIVGLHFVDGMAPELGYWLGEPYWGQGYATEATRAVVNAAKLAGVPTLRSRALSHNARSSNVLRKNGFVETGEGPDPAGTNAGKPATFMTLEFAR
jgi:RimJ/RimL family protein N-acetyltransferase